MEQCEIKSILKDLYHKGIGKLLVEAGPEITSEFLQSDHLDHLVLYFAPKIIGGSGKNQFSKLTKLYHYQIQLNLKLLIPR